VIGKPDEHWGEVPVVFVVADNGEKIEAERLFSALEGQLAHFKIPREAITIDELPRNVMGKILKYKLREDYL
jgi:acyl-CoA synthetase (AMP-forming)/AMP-acid ligase II